jgi:hypothetical protein
MSGSFVQSLRAAFDAREGLRGMLACAPMLMLGWAVHAPELTWAVVGAFWSVLVATSGPARSRVATMLAFGAVSTLCGGVAAWVAGFGLAAGTLAVLAAAVAAGLVRTRAPRYYGAAVLAAAVCVLMIDRTGTRDAGVFVLYAAGCLYATAVSAVIWQVAPPPTTPDDEPPAARPDFAARLGIAVALASLAVHLAHLRFGYWATIAVLLVLQPSVTLTWPRCIERALGTAAGTAIAMGLGVVVKAPLAIALAFLPSIGLMMALRTHSYRVFVALLTPAVILVADFAAPDAGYAFAFARLEDNLIGSAVAFVAALLFVADGRDVWWRRLRIGSGGTSVV